MHELIGIRVMHRITKKKGRITYVSDDKRKVSYADSEGVYSFPACLVDTFLLEDEVLQNKYLKQGEDASFEQFKNVYRRAVKYLDLKKVVHKVEEIMVRYCIWRKFLWSIDRRFKMQKDRNFRCFVLRMLRIDIV